MNNKKKLDLIHRQSLQRAIGALSGTPTAAMEVLSGEPPLQLYLEEVLLQEYLRIMQKPDSDPLRILVNKLISDELHLDTRIITSIHHINMPLSQLEKKNLAITPLEVRHLPTVQERHLALDMDTNTGSDLGSSKT